MPSKGTINELFDIPAIEKQVAKVDSLINEFIKKVGGASEAKVGLKGSGKPSDTIAGIEKVTKAQKEYADTVSKSVAPVTKLKKEQDEAAKSTSNLEKEKQKLAKASSKEAIELEKVKLQTSELNKKNKEAAKDALGLTNAYDKLAKQYAEAARKAQVLAVTKPGSPAAAKAAAEAKALNDQLKSIDAGVGKFQRNVGNYAGSLADAFEKVTAEISRLKAKQEGLQNLSASNPIGFKQQGGQDDLDKTTASLERLNRVQVEGFKTTGSQQQQVKALQKAFIDLSISGEAGAEFLEEFKRVVGEATDEVNDMKEAIKLAASDTRGLDLLIGGAQAVAGAFGVAQGVTAVFGEDNEELQKTLVKLNGVMTILNGLQAIQNELKKKDNIVTVSQIALQKLYTFVIGGATGALKTFRIAMAATGVGLLILGIGLLISKLSSLGDTAALATDDINKLSAALDALNFESSRALKDLEQENAKILAGLKARGASESEIGKAKISGLEKEKKLLDDLVKSSIDQYNSTNLRGFAVRDEINAVDQLKEARKRLANLTEEEKKVGGSLHEARIAGLEKIVAASDAAYDKENEITLAKVEEQGRIHDKGVENAKENAEKRLEIAERNANAIQEVEQMNFESRIRIAERVLEDEESSMSDKLVALEFIEKEKRAAIESAFNHEMALDKARTKDKKLTADEIKKLEKKKQTDLGQIVSDGEDKREAITKENDEKEKAKKEKAIADQAAHAQSVQDTELQLIENSFSARLIKLDEIYAQEQEAAIGNDKKLKELAEKYTEDKLKIEFERETKVLEQQIAFAEKQLAIAKAAATTPEEYDAIAKAEADLAALKIKLTGVVSAAKTASVGKSKKESDEEKSKLTSDLEEIKEKFEAVFSTIGSILALSIRKELNAIQEISDELDKQKEKAIEAVNASVDSEEKKAAKISVIEARHAAQKDVLEIRRRQAQQRQAEFEKAQAIASIILNTAIQISKSLGNPLLVAFVAALGAAQLAIAIATPIPKYKTGTDFHPGGPAEVGDGGRSEAVVLPSGEIYKTPSSSVVWDLPVGTKVYPDYDSAVGKGLETDKILSGLSGVRKAIEKIPQPVFQSEGRFKVMTRNGHEYKEYLNRNLQ